MDLSTRLYDSIYTNFIFFFMKIDVEKQKRYFVLVFYDMSYH